LWSEQGDDRPERKHEIEFRSWGTNSKKKRGPNKVVNCNNQERKVGGVGTVKDNIRTKSHTKWGRFFLRKEKNVCKENWCPGSLCKGEGEPVPNRLGLRELMVKCPDPKGIN